MEIKNERTNNIPNNLVWAKMRYCPYWPAKLVNTPPQLGRTPPNKTCVFFFGTKQFGFVEINNVEDYGQNREKFIKKGHGSVFNNAVKQIDEFISDPNNFHSNAFVKPIGAKLKIKTESHIAEHLGIKQEIQTKDTGYEQRSDSSRKQVPINKSSAQEKEKKKLIDAFATVKTENQKITLQLNKKNKECLKLVAEKEDLEQNIAVANAKITQLQSDLSQLRREYSEKMKEHKQNVLELHDQNGKLTARIQQLQNTMARNDEIDKKADDDDIYEVEKIIGDKKLRGVQYYRIKWKGFDETHNSWEREVNLMCPGILKKYKQTKNQP